MKVIKYFVLLVGFLLFSSSVNVRVGKDILLIVVKSTANRSVSYLPYVEASLLSRTVEVRFHENLGNVQVKIVSSCGDVIENQSIDTGSMSLVSIGIPSEEEDSYTLTIETPGGTLEGEFIL